VTLEVSLRADGQVVEVTVVERMTAQQARDLGVDLIAASDLLRMRSGDD
jgi:hypothetical protein